MKTYLIQVLATAGLLYSCGNPIKNENPNVAVEPGTVVPSTPAVAAASTAHTTPTETPVEQPVEYDSPVLGSWVGWFKNADRDNTEGEVNTDWIRWNKDNKINITIDSVNAVDSMAYGYSVVAGNERSFEGVYYVTQDGLHHFELNEPGDHKYDGQFIFDINTHNAIGVWEAYNDIQTPKRKYALERKTFHYNPDIMLEEDSWYVDWRKTYDEKDTVEYEDGEFEEFTRSFVATSSYKIFEINASNTVLTAEDVENLSKGDLKIIRNTIYARHGYSFKNKPLRVFFDQQTWYIPMYANIQKEFSKTETDNIRLLLKYEKNAEEYYDYFGR